MAAFPVLAALTVLAAFPVLAVLTVLAALPVLAVLTVFAALPALETSSAMVSLGSVGRFFMASFAIDVWRGVENQGSPFRRSPASVRGPNDPEREGEENHRTRWTSPRPPRRQTFTPRDGAYCTIYHSTRKGAMGLAPVLSGGAGRGRNCWISLTEVPGNHYIIE